VENLTHNKKIKIHIKNNHGRSGTFPCDLEGEKNFTITKEHLDKALENQNKKTSRVFYRLG
jgi:galactose mutarotase-like enzyme